MKTLESLHQIHQRSIFPISIRIKHQSKVHEATWWTNIMVDKYKTEQPKKTKQNFSSKPWSVSSRVKLTPFQKHMLIYNCLMKMWTCSLNHTHAIHLQQFSDLPSIPSGNPFQWLIIGCSNALSS